MKLFNGFKSKLTMTALLLILALFVAACGSQGNNTNGSTNTGRNTGDTPKADAPAEAPKAKDIVLRLSEAQVDDYPDAIAEKAFAALVEERSEGRIKVEVYTGGQLGDEKTTIEQTQVGIVDIGRANAGPLTQFADKFGIFSFPFLFDSRDHMWSAIDGTMGEKLFENLAKADLIGLAFYDAGARSFYTKEPIRNLGDVKGNKIRVMQNDLLIEAFNLIDASPTPLSASEVYSALQMGVITGGENNVSTYVADGHYEVAPYYTLSEHLRIPGVLFMSKKSWDKLSKEDQEIIAQAAKESEAIQIAAYDKYSMEAMEKVLATKGNEVINLSAEERQKFQDKVKPLYQKYENEYGELFEAINDVK